jgi:hypothetical protein
MPLEKMGRERQNARECFEKVLIEWRDGSKKVLKKPQID